jgi:hypothetical protein
VDGRFLGHDDGEGQVGRTKPFEENTTISVTASSITMARLAAAIHVPPPQRHELTPLFFRGHHLFFAARIFHRDMSAFACICRDRACIYLTIDADPIAALGFSDREAFACAAGDDRKSRKA